MTERRKEMTVGDLRRALSSLPDDMPVVGEYREENEDDVDVEGIGGLVSATVEYRCADTPSLFLLIDSNVGGERDD